MSRRLTSFVTVAATVAIAASYAGAQLPQGAPAGAMAETPMSALEWKPAQPPGFNAGMEMAVVSGDPTKPGFPYVLRLRFPDGYRFPAHFHPVPENLTVLQGEFLLAMGERADEAKLKTYRPGDFLFIDANHPHFGGAKGATTIQLHGMGPFAIIVAGSPEDKRKY